MPMQGSLSVERMCQLARVSRAGFYRSMKEHLPQEEDTEVRSAIQRIALEHRRRYGYRRVSAELRRRGMAVNHKRVARMMREDNLLAVQRRQFVTTTDSDHALEIYLNLARRMKLTGIDQLWVADITYIRLQAEFVYLAVVLDGFSRRVVGWNLDRTLTSRLAIEALQGAIESRRPLPGLVHHSDRGVQYASAEYVAILTSLGIVPSMSRPAESVRQRQLRELHQDPEAGGNLRQRVRRSGTPAGSRGGVHRAVLQPAATALRPWLLHAR
jgi:transposase InsO family protein